MTEHAWKERWIISLAYEADTEKFGYSTFGEVRKYDTEPEAFDDWVWLNKNPDKWTPPGAVRIDVSEIRRQVYTSTGGHEQPPERFRPKELSR